MTKSLYIFILISLSNLAFSQQVVKTKAYYRGILVTKITKSKSPRENERDTSRIIYISNKTGDSISVYTVTMSVVTEAVGYSIITKENDTFLNVIPVYSGGQPADSLVISFNDAKHNVIVNKHDLYTLYPAFYTRFKYEVKTKHSVMAVLNLLNDNIGDYPLANTAPLLLFLPGSGNGKQIKRARIVTQRSQAEDITDTLLCTYLYNKNNKLIAVGANSREELSFSKKIAYTGDKITGIRLYRNIEDRQITNGVVTYRPGNSSTLKLIEHVLETGKNLETDLSSTLTIKELGNIKSNIIPQVDLLNIIKNN